MKKILFLLLSFSLFFSCKKEEGKPVIQDIKELVFASGNLEWKNSYNLTAQTDGILQNADFEVGDTVVKGNLVASIDNKTNAVNTETAEEQLAINNENLSLNSPQLQQLRQNITIAENKYQQDRLQAERYERLYKSQSVAKVEYENMLLQARNSLSNLNALKAQQNQILQQAKSAVVSTKGQLKNSRVQQAYNQVRAPQNGKVIKKLKATGDFVRKGEVIAVVADDTQVLAVLHVDENSMGKVKLGQPAYVQLNTHQEKTYTGKVSEILSAFDVQTQSFIVHVQFDEDIQQSLFGTQLEANILVGEKKNALLIPRKYVGFGNRVNIKGKDEMTVLKTGIVSTDFVEVLEGLTKDDILLPLKP